MGFTNRILRYNETGTLSQLTQSVIQALCKTGCSASAAVVQKALDTFKSVWKLLKYSLD